MWEYFIGGTGYPNTANAGFLPNRTDFRSETGTELNEYFEFQTGERWFSEPTDPGAETVAIQSWVNDIPIDGPQLRGEMEASFDIEIPMGVDGWNASTVPVVFGRFGQTQTFQATVAGIPGIVLEMAPGTGEFTMAMVTFGTTAVSSRIFTGILPVPGCHYHFDVRIRASTTTPTANGVFQMWIDSNLVAESTTENTDAFNDTGSLQRSQITLLRPADLSATDLMDFRYRNVHIQSPWSTANAVAPTRYYFNEIGTEPASSMQSGFLNSFIPDKPVVQSVYAPVQPIWL